MKRTFKGMLAKALSFILCGAMLISLCPTVSMAAVNYTVAWIGGSFTQGVAPTRFVDLVTNWMNETKYAGEGINITSVNAGVGGTTSQYGLLRYDEDVLSKNPNLVIIEFGGNDSILTDFSGAINGMEGMIRRTIAKSPETKIAVLFRPSWNGNTAAKAYHKLVADYYDVPIITADEVATNPEWVLEDGVHPNDVGNEKIAEYIESWLAKNEINLPTHKQFPINPVYRPIVPVMKNVKDLYDAEKTTGWTVDEEGNLVSSSVGDKLYLNVKGSIINLPGVEGADGYGTYVVDSYTVGTKEGSRRAGYINGGSMMIDLSIGDGEHSVVITNNSAKTLKLNKIRVDAVAYGEAEAFETPNCTIFEDDIHSTEQKSNIKTTDKGGVVTYGNYNYITGDGDTRGLAFAQPAANIAYTLANDGKYVGSIRLRLSMTKSRAQNNTAPWKVFAVNDAAEKTELPLYTCLKSTGDGMVAENGMAITEEYAVGVPADTVSLVFEKPTNEDSYSSRVLNIMYSMGAATMEKVSLDAPAQLLEGDKGLALIKGVYSNGSQRQLDDAEIQYFSSDSNVAAVNVITGEITAKSAGKAEIYAEVTVGGKTYEASAKITVYAQTNIEEAYFSVPKTNYVAGTKGKIDFITKMNGVISKNIFSAEYSSDNEKVVKIASDGSFEAVGTGKAVISVSSPVLTQTFEPIVINVSDSNVVESYPLKDISSGTLAANMLNNLDGLAAKRKGTKLFGATYGSNAIAKYQGNYMFNYTTQALASQYMAFVYNIDDGLESLWADASAWDVDQLKKRLQIAYLSDDTYTFKDAAYPEEVLTITDGRLTGYGLRNAVSEKAENGADIINSHWSIDNALEWQTISGAPSTVYATSKSIPEGAKYALVFVNSGLLSDGTEALRADYSHFAGVKLTYKAKIAAGEITRDGKIAITYNKDMANPALTVLVNGNAVEAETTYDADTFTSYIDMALGEGDTVTVTANGVLGQFSKTIADDREQIDSVVLKGSDNTPITEISTGETSVSISAKVVNTTEKKVNIVAAFYRGDKLMKVSMPNNTQVVPANGTAEAEFTLDFGTGAESGDCVKIFCWKENLAPFDNFKAIQTTFGMEDF